LALQKRRRRRIACTAGRAGARPRAPIVDPLARAGGGAALVKGMRANGRKMEREDASPALLL
jgi:hypothetical protein